ncbi:branched-chain-amino-acid aminotransferase-like protein 2, partial [Trifolium medium]|nr:branched-chain-amino-acid aminotransferase-like protein 2 [Trifolium medium]
IYQVSVFDSVVQGGDSVWEGLRVYKSKIFKLEEHLDRMADSAKALAFENVPSRDEVSLKMLYVHPSRVSESVTSFFYPDGLFV